SAHSRGVAIPGWIRACVADKIDDVFVHFHRLHNADLREEALKVSLEDLDPADKIHCLDIRDMRPVMRRMQRKVRIPANLVDLFISQEGQPSIEVECGPAKLGEIFGKLRSDEIPDPWLGKHSGGLVLDVFL